MTKQKKKIHKCSECNKPAVWYYMPSSNGKRYFCDDHVPRGCSCNLHYIELFGEPDRTDNIIWLSKEAYKKYQESESRNIFDFATFERQEDSFYYEYLDEQGRRYPCCEYDYDENGQEFD